MKDKIKEYIELTPSEKSDLCNSATFVFDTNVLLDLYRCSRNTQEAIFDSIENLRDRIWIPYQVAKEFMTNRIKTILDLEDKYDKLKISGREFISKFKEISKIDDDKQFDVMQKSIDKWINDYKKENYGNFDINNDRVCNRILKLFDNKVGDPFDEDKLEYIYKEGEERYKKQIPPGYKDDKKKKDEIENNAYGDLIVWKEILNYSKENKKDIVFVTGDKKDDWWNNVKGRTIGPRVELRKEFIDFTGNKFHMYDVKGFIKLNKKLNGKEAVIKEIDDLKKENNKISSIGIINQDDIIRRLNTSFIIHRANLINLKSQYNDINDRIDHLQYNGGCTSAKQLAYLSSLNDKLEELNLQINQEEIAIKEIKDRLYQKGINMDSLL